MPAARLRPAARTAGLLLTATALGATACYRYVPAPAADPAAPGLSVRARLTPEGAARLTPVLGADARTVDGRVFAVEPAAVVLEVTAVGKAGDARPTNWAGERVTLPRDAVATLERRQLDRSRTLRAVAFSVAGAALGGWLFAQISGGAESRGGAPPVDPRP